MGIGGANETRNEKENNMENRNIDIQLGNEEGGKKEEENEILEAAAEAAV